MSYKNKIHKGMGIGFLSLIVVVLLGWFLMPVSIYTLPSLWQKLLFLYVLPLGLGVLSIVIKRYESEDLILGYQSSNKGLELNKAYLQNTIEQTMLAVPLVVSFGSLAPAYLAKVIPVHLCVFLFGRLCFWFGYKKSPAARIPGFIITIYANVGLFLGCCYVLVFT